MAYQRKTRDCWDIETNWGYGGGWEYECREYSLKDAKAQQRRYIENCGGRCGIRLVKRRERIENGEGRKHNDEHETVHDPGH